MEQLILLLALAGAEQGECAAEWLDRAELARQLETELALTSTQSISELRIDCAEDADAITVLLGTTEQIDLATVPKALRTRSLALIIAENMRAIASRADRADRADRDEAPAASPEPVVLASPPKIAVRSFIDLFTGPALTAYLDHDTQLYGGRLGAARELDAAGVPLRVALELHLALGTGRDPLGSVSVETGALALSAAPLLRFGAVRISVGPRFGAALVRFSGATERAGITTSGGNSSVLSPALELNATLALLEELHLHLNAAAGTALHGAIATADDRTIAGISGPFVTASLAVATRLFLD